MEALGKAVGLTRASRPAVAAAASGYLVHAGGVALDLEHWSNMEA